MTNLNTSSVGSAASQGLCHLAGVAGSGMSGLAQLLLAEGWQVSGSDRFHDKGGALPILRKLADVGVALFPQDGSGVLSAECTVIMSSAVESDNPDVQAARKLGSPIVSRAEMLARLSAGKKVVAIAGTCGKSTVTGMAGWILEKLGADPTVVNGAGVIGWANETRIGNVRVGRSGLWVLEVDESDKSLLKFNPEYAVVTNMSKDHFDQTETEALFAQFRSRVGKTVVGAGGKAPPRAEDLVQSAFDASFEVAGVPFRLNLPGRHNVENALSAVGVCLELGYRLEDISKALESFAGIERRLEVVGQARGATVIDDFAHNPEKIRAAMETVLPHFRRVFAVWRPHGFKPLAFMAPDLVELLGNLCRPGDKLFVLPVYYAGGTVQRKKTSAGFAADLRRRGVNAVHCRSFDTCARLIASALKKGDAVLCMGARDPELPVFARNIVKLAGEPPCRT